MASTRELASRMRGPLGGIARNDRSAAGYQRHLDISQVGNRRGRQLPEGRVSERVGPATSLPPLAANPSPTVWRQPHMNPWTRTGSAAVGLALAGTISGSLFAVRQRWVGDAALYAQ